MRARPAGCAGSGRGAARRLGCVRREARGPSPAAVRPPRALRLCGGGLPSSHRALRGSRLLGILLPWPAGPAGGDGRPVRDFRDAWAKACIAAGLCATGADGTKRATALFHDFRRSCVRNLENAGTPRKVAKSITGHITDAVYERYHVVKDEDQRAALARVEAGFRIPAQIPPSGALAPSWVSAK